MDVVLYTDASPPRPVNPRLDRHHSTRNKLPFVCSGKSRRFMDFQAQAMSEAVPKSVAVALSVNVAPSERVGSHSGHSCSDRMCGNMVGVAYDFIDIALLRCRDSDDERTRNIAAITAVL